LREGKWAGREETAGNLLQGPRKQRRKYFGGWTRKSGKKAPRPEGKKGTKRCATEHGTRGEKEGGV